MKKVATTESNAALLINQLAQARKEVAKTFVFNVIKKKGFKIDDTDRAVNKIAIFEGKLNRMQSK